MKIIIAAGGSSGSIYTRVLLDQLRAFHPSNTIAVVLSDNAVVNWKLENGHWDPSIYPYDFYEKDDFMAPFASGSAGYTHMVICPCSMGLLSRIATGMSNDLITRAADVILKERRKLIVVPRETPFNLIHLRNMVHLTEAGGIVCPAIPSFYSQPKDRTELIRTVTDRVIDLMGLESGGYRWGETGAR